MKSGRLGVLVALLVTVVLMYFCHMTTVTPKAKTPIEHTYIEVEPSIPVEPNASEDNGGVDPEDKPTTVETLQRTNFYI